MKLYDAFCMFGIIKTRKSLFLSRNKGITHDSNQVKRSKKFRPDYQRTLPLAQTHVPHLLFAQIKANACFLCMTLKVKTKYLEAIIMVP